jgi:protein-L-isoaspartate(D-aspartate) O-methyltransferase
MVREQIAARGVRDARVLAAMGRVPRECFVDARLGAAAYDDKPLPIGTEQTISQPYMVGAMTEALELGTATRVLEIGTGCGYQTAVLAELGATVFSIERHAALAEAAGRRLEDLGYRSVRIRTGDGTLGWPEEAPFDAVLVTAGSPGIPRPLVAQLAVGGRLVFPMGDEELQTLVRIRKNEDGLQEDCLGECRFVPLVGRYGWDR